MTQFSEAAQARSAAIATPADRPAHRRCAYDNSAPAIVRAALHDVQIRAQAGDSTLLDFEGYATITETPYEMYDFFGPYTEIVSKAAPALALVSQPDVNFVLNHGGVPFARTKSGTLALSADEIGLHVAASMDGRMPSVQDVRYALERGDLDEMSFKFRITRGIWSPDYTEFRIEEFDINRGDVSVVNYGANPYTSAALRSKLDPSKLDASDLRACFDEFTKRGLKPALSRAQADALSM